MFMEYLVHNRNLVRPEESNKKSYCIEGIYNIEKVIDSDVLIHV